MSSPPLTLDEKARSASHLQATGWVTLGLLSLGHAFVDIYSSALGALQPYLVQQYGLSFTQAGFLGGMLLLSSSVTQPLYGLLSDRWHTKLFTALGPAVAGIFISCLGMAPSYGWLIAMVWLGGVGIAMFHPQASARATMGVREGRGRAMAIFVSAGTLGFALGPTYFSTILAKVGFSGMWISATPGILVSLFLLVVLPPAAPPAGLRKREQGATWTALRGVWRPLALLYALVFIRSILQTTYAQFLPLYLTHHRGMSKLEASYTLSIYLLGGAIGGFLGGNLADRFGARRVILISMIGSTPFLLLFFFTTGWLSTTGLVLGGFILLFTIPVNVVVAQELAPRQAGTISALMMGFAWGMAGLVFIPFTGWMSDLFSLHTALLGLTAFPVIGFFLTLRLPSKT